PERGRKFQDVVYGRFGQHEILDHAGALRQLAAARPYMDLDRVGITGGSWGGYMTVRAILTAPDLYKVAVAVNPCVEVSEQLASGIEAYMGLPSDNREGYDAASNLKLASQLEGRLLLVHGTADVNVPIAHSLKLIEALTQAGKPYDFMMLNHEKHLPQG